MTIIKKGQGFTISSEERDDFKIIAFYEALVEIDTDTLLDEYVKLHPQDLSKTPKNFDYSDFATWLIQDRNVAKKISFKDWHLGDYGDINSTVEDWF